jgi:hypothetical protein
VNAFAPGAMTATVAVLATFAKGTIGLTILFAVCTRLAAAGSSILHFVFASAMVLSELIRPQNGGRIVSTKICTLPIADESALSPDMVMPRFPASRAA